MTTTTIIVEHLPQFVVGVAGATGALWAIAHFMRKTLLDANRDARLLQAEQAVYRNYADLINNMKQEMLRQRDEIARLGDVTREQQAKVLHLERVVGDQSRRIGELTATLMAVKNGSLDPLNVPTDILYPNSTLLQSKP